MHLSGIFFLQIKVFIVKIRYTLPVIYQKKTHIITVLHYLWMETLFLNYSMISFSDLRKRFEREPLMTRVQVSKTTQLDCLPPEGKPLPEVSS